MSELSKLLNLPHEFEKIVLKDVYMVKDDSKLIIECDIFVKSSIESVLVIGTIIQGESNGA